MRLLVGTMVLLFIVSVSEATKKEDLRGWIHGCNSRRL